MASDNEHDDPVAKLKEMYNRGCCDGKLSGETCTSRIPFEDACCFSLSLQGLSHSARTALLCGLITACRKEGGNRKPANRSLSRNNPVKSFMPYMLLGNRVCRDYMTTVCSVSKKVLLRASSLSSQMFTPDFRDFDETRGGRRASSSINQEDAKHVIAFIDDYASHHALPDPGRCSRSGQYGLKLQLPYSCTFVSMFDVYENYCATKGLNVLCLNSFRQIWSDCRPNIVRLPKRSDMCTTCGQLSNILSFHLQNGDTIRADECLEHFKKHRDNAKHARLYYKECKMRAQDAWKSRKTIDGKLHVSYSVISVDFAQSVRLPSRSDQLGDIFFESPVTCGFFGITEEGAMEQRTYLLREERTFTKSGSSVGSMIFDYLSDTNVVREELQIFADNTASQNKNQFLFSLLSLLAIKKEFGCNKLRLSFMCVGHTKFSPDSWFGVLKNRLMRCEINSVLDVEESVLNSSHRDDAGFLGFPKQPHVPKFTHCPFDNSTQCTSFNLNELHSKFFRHIVGQSQFFDIIFMQDGSLMWRGAPCGDDAVSDVHSWHNIAFSKNVDVIRSFDLSNLSPCPESIMNADRSLYIFRNIRKFVQLGEKIYPLHSHRGPLRFRDLTCPAPHGVDAADVSVEAELSNITSSGTECVPSVTALQQMGKPQLLEYVLAKHVAMSRDEGLKLTKKKMIDMLRPFAFSRKRKHLST